MTTSESGKYLYWEAGETINVKLTEMYNVRKYRKTEDAVVGEAVWKHFKKGESPMICSNDRKCPQCKAGLKPIIRFNTSIILMDDGEEYFCELPISLSRIFAEKQVAFEEAGLDEDDILEKVFMVKKFKEVVAPYWEVKVVTDKATKGKKKTVKLEDLDDDDSDDVEDETNDSDDKKELDSDEVDLVDDLIAKLEAKLGKNPDYDWEALAKKTLKKEFKDDWKVDEGLELIKFALEDTE